MTFWDVVWREANFFRIHLSAFVFVPLIFSGIFYASNGRFHIQFIDSLFLCYSSMTDTGLSTVNLSTLTAWQQVILYLLMMLGDTTFISWLMVMTRKHYFKTQCIYVASHRPVRHRSRASLLASISRPVRAFQNQDVVPPRKTSPIQAQEVDITKGPTIEITEKNSEQQFAFDSASNPDANVAVFSSSPTPFSIPLPSSHPPSHLELIEEASVTSPDVLRQRRVLTFREEDPYPRLSPSVLSKAQNTSEILPSGNKRDPGFGGFPGPIDLIHQLFKRAAPLTYSRLKRTITIPSVTTLEEKKTPWLNFSGLVVGRNSNFRTDTLTSEQIQQIGGTEYKALEMLSWMVPAYFVCIQLIGFLVFAPWLLVTTKYDAAFRAQHRLVSKAWFSLFLVTSTYTGTGLSLMDTSMQPFQQAYLMIFGIIFVLLAGNHGQPIFLRLIIWTGYKLSLVGSETHQTLSFLLHHSRRCFLYLFPSHQTYFLLIVLVLFSAIEWAGFGILNIGLPTFQALPIRSRVILGLFQGITVRASGLGIVPISTLAPALQFLYAVLMYIAIYPIALCIRSTNVYEERSLGIFEAPLGDMQEDLEKLPPRERIGRYFNWHFRRQLSVDIWWLVWGIFIVAIIERGDLIDPNKSWFNMFAVIFELVSAFAGIGLSLGFPEDNFSLVGTMKPLSKIVVIIIMIRGRHRGLPVAIDRAVLLPTELVVNSAGNRSSDSIPSNMIGIASPAQEEHPANAQEA